MKCVMAQDQMSDIPVPLSHSLSFLAGVCCSLWWLGGQASTGCPDCVVTCGGCSCPPVYCSTGHFDVGPVTLGLSLCLLAGTGLWFWCSRDRSSVSKPVESKPAGLDGRRALGASLSWRPEPRDSDPSVLRR